MYVHKRTDTHTHTHAWSGHHVRTAADWNAKLEQINMMAPMIQLSLHNPFCSGSTGQRIVVSHVTAVLRGLGLFWYTGRLITRSNIFSITNKVTGTLLSLLLSLSLSLSPPFSVNRKIKTFMGQRPSLLQANSGFKTRSALLLTNTHLTRLLPLFQTALCCHHGNSRWRGVLLQLQLLNCYLLFLACLYSLLLMAFLWCTLSLSECAEDHPSPSQLLLTLKHQTQFFTLASAACLAGSSILAAGVTS